MKNLARLIKPLIAVSLLCTGFSAQAIDWVSCAKENETCNVKNQQPVIVRYGNPNYAYFYYSMAGVPKFTCGNFNGDPMPGVSGKTCSYSADTLLGFTDNTIAKKIAKENDTVTGTTQLRWIHYGLPISTLNNNRGTWWNVITAETWKCSNDALNYDPTKGQPPKSCYEGVPVPVELSSDGVSPNWINCGYENSVCTLPTELKSTPVVLRYGYGSNWVYRIAVINKLNTGKPGIDIKCQTSTFNEDPIKVNKVCEYAQIVPKASATIGTWTKVVDTDCDGKTVCASYITLNVGTDYTTSNTNSSAWSKVVSNSIQSGGILGVGYNGSSSLDASKEYSKSSSYTWAINRKKREDVTVDCATTQAGRLTVYQFSTTTSANCLQNGSCSNTTSTSDVQCVMNPPAGYSGPQCLPTYCSPNDALCPTNTCTYH